MEVPIRERTGYRRVLILCGALLASASGAGAQETSILKPGTRVRVVIAEGAPRYGADEHRKLTGKLLGLSDSVLTLEMPTAGPPAVLPRRDVASLAVSLGRDQRGTGALIGFGVGIGAGVLVGQVSGDDEDCFICISAADKSLFAALILAPLGALVGALGAPAEEWQLLPLDRVRMGLDSTGGRPAISVGLRF